MSDLVLAAGCFDRFCLLLFLLLFGALGLDLALDFDLPVAGVGAGVVDLELVVERILPQSGEN